MKDIYKNPILYCILVPVIVGLWPLLVWAVYLPDAQKNIKEHKSQYQDSEPIIMEILTLDSGRLEEFADPNETAMEFTYSRAVDRIANTCGIPPSKYKVSTSMIITTREQKSQSATVDLKQVDIAKFAGFLWEIQLSWANLQCERVKLTKKQNLPDNDMWDFNIEFKYYY
ncbi:MAG: hypothetical protein ACYTBV_20410 [Planctomycetota bacterium]|jgi:hypothetical protein